MTRITEGATHTSSCAFRHNPPQQRPQRISRWLIWATLCLTLMLSAVGCFGAIGGPIPDQDGGTQPDNTQSDTPGTTPDASPQDDPATDETNKRPDAQPGDVKAQDTATDGGPDQPAKDQPTADGNQCGDVQSSDPLPQDIYFDDVVKGFLQEFCVKCHDASNQLTGSLAEYNNASRGALTNKPAQFWQKAYDRIHHTDSALRMPPDGSVTNACEDIERFKYGVRLFDEWKKRGFPYDASGTNPNRVEPTPTPTQFPNATTCTGKEPLPARVWRLTNQQLQYSITDAFGGNVTPPTFKFDYTLAERKHGFDNDANTARINAKSMADLIKALQGFSGQVLTKVNAFSSCLSATNAQAKSCARNLITTYGKKLWRRPLTQAEIDDIFNAHEAIQNDPAGSRRDATAFIIERLLFSPYFLYRSELGQPAQGRPGIRQLTPYEVASFLSYTVWQSIPDAALLTAAANDRLQQPADLLAQLNRMLQDPKAKRGTMEFFSDWLQLNKVLNLTDEDSQRYGLLTNAMKQDMKKETELLLDDVIWQRKGDLKTLFTTTNTFANVNTSKLYKLSVGTKAFKAVALPASKRAGILTTPAYLVSHTTATGAKFVRRGVFFLEGLLCKHIPAPPADAVQQGLARQDKTDTTKMTTREVQDKVHAQGSCMSCHKEINPAGAAFELFDPIGRFRLMEKTPSGTSKPIDATGEIKGYTDLKPDFQDTVGLIKNLANSEHFQKCFAIKLFTYKFGHEVAPAQSCEVARVYDHLKSSQFKLSEIYKAILQTENFLYRKESIQSP